MNKKITAVTLIPFLLITLTGCAGIGDKSTSISVIYGITSLFSFLLLVGYCTLVRKKDIYFYLLFISVFVVNSGYFLLSVAPDLTWTLHANRLSYLGSVFLPFSMFMIITNVCRLRRPRYLSWILLGVSIFVFFVAASPGYLDIYYKSVSLKTVNGITLLIKEYGPWHVIYLFYLIAYFAIMIFAIIYADTHKTTYSTAHAVTLLIAVFVNICVWLLEQLIRIDFEFLSVSYIISELFMIAAHLMVQDTEVVKDDPTSNQSEKVPAANEDAAKNVTIEKCNYFKAQISTLTPTEMKIYNLYVEGNGTKNVLQELNITENTLKYHNKNIYSKLGVNSRKELISIALKNQADD